MNSVISYQRSFLRNRRLSQDHQVLKTLVLKQFTYFSRNFDYNPSEENYQAKDFLSYVADKYRIEKQSFAENPLTCSHVGITNHVLLNTTAIAIY